ncbi:hypothetical protein G6F19_013719 [Rhizopus arrhizus]|nr:hypothetical protein G6F24_015044 [Rhizopus arrhizus]KAG0808497.1 hypothetical protein G6F19_013719 [Rhizopus arrhizus]KAG0923667.1 hypothetical protein G6F32_014192 [Rhizopus arrhizus]KAG1084706.1 hypothetical protein G6F40_014410 [Rhizopus arrhizus]
MFNLYIYQFFNISSWFFGMLQQPRVHSGDETSGVKKGSSVYPEGYCSLGSVDLYWWRPSIPDTVVV